MKNALIGDERSINRKVKEALLAVQLERTSTKQRILELYLNTIYFGNGAYGVEAASQTYFGTPASQIDVAQGSAARRADPVAEQHRSLRPPARSRGAPRRRARPNGRARAREA